MKIYFHLSDNFQNVSSNTITHEKSDATRAEFNVIVLVEMSITKSIKGRSKIVVLV